MSNIYNIFWTCVCILSYLAFNVHELYYSHLWPVWLYHVFSYYLINTTIFGKKLLNINCVFWFSLQRLFETILIVRRIQRDSTINLRTSSYEIFFSQILIKHEFYREIFEKYSNMKFHENPSSGNSVISMRTDRQTIMAGLIVAFRSFANAPKNEAIIVSTCVQQVCKHRGVCVAVSVLECSTRGEGPVSNCSCTSAHWPRIVVNMETSSVGLA
jgi:hypothetical protein